VGSKAIDPLENSLKSFSAFCSSGFLAQAFRDEFLFPARRRVHDAGHHLIQLSNVFIGHVAGPGGIVIADGKRSHAAFLVFFNRGLLPQFFPGVDFPLAPQVAIEGKTPLQIEFVDHRVFDRAALQYFGEQRSGTLDTHHVAGHSGQTRAAPARKPRYL